MPLIDISLPQNELDELTAALKPDQVPKAIVLAANKTLAKVKTRTVRTLKEHVPFKVSEIRDQITVQKATYSKPTASVTISYKSIPLIRYGAVQTPRGVVVKTTKVGAAELFRHYFIATMPNGYVGVFSRKPDAKGKLVDIKNGRKVYHGLKIQQQSGPSLAGVFAGAPGVLDDAIQFASDDFEKQILSQVDHFLARRKVDRPDSDDSTDL